MAGLCRGAQYFPDKGYVSVLPSPRKISDVVLDEGVDTTTESKSVTFYCTVYTSTKIRNKYSQKRNCAAKVPKIHVSQFTNLYVSDLCIPTTTETKSVIFSCTVYTAPKIRNKNSQKRNCAAKVPKIHVSVIEFPRSICLFCCRKVTFSCTVDCKEPKISETNNPRKGIARGHSPSFHIHVCLWTIYIFSQSIGLFCCRKYVNLSLTDHTWKWKLGLRPGPEKACINGIFVAVYSQKRSFRRSKKTDVDIIK